MSIFDQNLHKKVSDNKTVALKYKLNHLKSMILAHHRIENNRKQFEPQKKIMEIVVAQLEMP